MFSFDPESFYDDATLRQQGIDGDVLRRARKAGELRYKPLGRGVIVYKGQWLIDWLSKDAERREDGRK